MTQQQNVLSWLKDAHAMEQGAVLNLENHAAAAEGYPEVQSKLYGHAEATRQHAILVERCIERLGGHPSVLKEAIGTVMGKVQGVANLPAQDTVVKNALGDLAAEHFEIASYTSLIAAAEHTGDEETATVCRRILRDEEEMADWLHAQISVITRKFLAEQTGEESRSPQAQVLGSVKDSVQGKVKALKGQGRELAASAKQSGKSALITSGALLAGAGAGLLIVQALRSGAAEKRRAQEGSDDGSSGAYDDMRAGYADGSAEPLSALDLHSESLDSSEPFMQDSGLSTVLEPQAEESSDELTGQDVESSDPFLQGQPQSVDDVLSAGPDLADNEEDSEEDVSALVYTEVWLMPGSYSGLGPSGYDSAGDPVGQEVYSRLTQHGQVDASNIEIVIDDGEVLLEGTVNSEETKRLAEEAVETVSGVDRVQNLLRVQASEEDM
jgi:ferritin-like metal-binding protein YciE